jgi:Predicted transcription factor, homolog of eukaryotic MBF1
MNLEKTGRLIAACRTEKGLTQQQLADKLFVTDKAVSKWERGKSFPGVDLLEPLGKELGLSVTELLSGERIPPEALSAASDRVSVDQLRESNKIRRRLRILAAVLRRF